MDKKQPDVAIIGAGPGDPELLTVKATRYIKNCDVILYDSLFGDEILNIIPADIEKIFVGKTYGDKQDQKQRQQKINNLFIQKLKEGKKIVRLKTGDPLIFSRGIEEIKFLVENQIHFEIIPGITAALAGACELAIPLTERFYSSSIILTTGHLAKDEMFPVHLYYEFIRNGGCLIIYMGFKLLDKICMKLISENFGSDLKFIIASNISNKEQKIIKGDLFNINGLSSNLKTPAIVYIGKHIEILNKK